MITTRPTRPARITADMLAALAHVEAHVVTVPEFDHRRSAQRTGGRLTTVAVRNSDVRVYLSSGTVRTLALDGYITLTGNMAGVAAITPAGTELLNTSASTARHHAVEVVNHRPQMDVPRNVVNCSCGESFAGFTTALGMTFPNMGASWTAFEGHRDNA